MSNPVLVLDRVDATETALDESLYDSGLEHIDPQNALIEAIRSKLTDGYTQESFSLSELSAVRRGLIQTTDDPAEKLKISDASDEEVLQLARSKIIPVTV